MSPPPDSDPDGASDGESIDDDRLVEAIRAAPRPVVNTRYLVLELDVPFDVLFDRLESLAEEGRLEHLEVRDRGHLWSLSLDEEFEE